jgi:pimeloyl-ACP methyl ester carboxylesterase
MNHPVHRARYNLQRRLGKLRMPTLLVWGEHDEVNPVEMGEQMHASISTSQFVTLPSGHYVPSEAPEEFNETVVRFLHEHRSAGDIL